MGIQQNSKLVCLPQFSQNDIVSSLLDKDETYHHYSILEIAHHSKSDKSLSANRSRSEEGDVNCKVPEKVNSNYFASQDRNSTHHVR